MNHAARIIVNLTSLICAGGVFYLVTLILAEDVAKPAWVPFDYQAGPWLSILLRLFGVVIITPPAAALLFSIMRIGAEQKRRSLFQDQQGDCVSLQLPTGTRVAAVGLGCGLFLAVVAVLIWQEEPWGIWLFASPIMALGLYCVLVFSMIQVDFDQDHIVAMTPLFRWEQHAWAELEAITFHHNWQELRLHFRDGRKARVSTYFNNLADFIAFAKAKIEESDDARTARS